MKILLEAIKTVMRGGGGGIITLSYMYKNKQEIIVLTLYHCSDLKKKKVISLSQESTLTHKKN